MNIRRHPRRKPGYRGTIGALAVLYACTLTGCGEIAFKRGSGPDAFAADKHACQARNPAQDSVNACLSRAGWKVAEPEPAAPAVSPAPAEGKPAQEAAAHTLLVGGWWKFGAGTADLRSDADACAARLGPANAPDAGLHRVTPAFYACLREGGWHGLAHPQK